MKAYFGSATFLYMVYNQRQFVLAIHSMHVFLHQTYKEEVKLHVHWSYIAK